MNQLAHASKPETVRSHPKRRHGFTLLQTGVATCRRHRRRTSGYAPNTTHGERDAGYDGVEEYAAEQQEYGAEEAFLAEEDEWSDLPYVDKEDDHFRSNRYR